MNNCSLLALLFLINFIKPGYSKDLSPYNKCLLEALTKIKLTDPELDQKIISSYKSCQHLKT